MSATGANDPPDCAADSYSRAEMARPPFDASAIPLDKSGRGGLRKNDNTPAWRARLLAMGWDAARMTAEIIAVAAHKGGQTKTSTSVNLSAGLARASWRVLLVDCDAQANSTSMYADEDDIEFDLLDIVKRDVDPHSAVCETRIPGLHLLPSTLAVARLDQELITMHRREEQIAQALAPLADEYDVMVLDLSPNLGPVVIAALCAATSLIVPTDASRWGRRGVSMFLEWSEDLRTAKVLSADLLGVLLTKYEQGTLISREVHRDLRQSGLPLFKTLIPKRTAAERMVAEKLVMGDEGADMDLSEAYGKLTLEVIERVNAVRGERLTEGSA
jgi:chromosome partitioning protein